jgi:hypothetical protein
MNTHVDAAIRVRDNAVVTLDGFIAGLRLDMLRV